MRSRIGDAIARQLARAADASVSRDGGPLRADGRWIRVLPFTVIAGAAIALALVAERPAGAEGAHIETAVSAAILLAALILITLLVPWERLNPDLQMIAPFAAMVVVLLVRHAQGSAGSGYSILYVLPIVWLALYSPMWQLLAGLVTVGALILLPPLLDGPLLGEEHYPGGAVALSFIVLLIIVFVGSALRMATDAAAEDGLTGLPNRRVFMARLRMSGHRARPDDRPMTVAILDLDHFKRYNDTHGHHAGDRLLRATALQWRSFVRERDLLARIGGEEFGLLVEGDVHECEALLNRLIASVPHGQTASAGLAPCRADDDPGDVLRRADEALYAAKAAGRARVMAAAP